MPPENTTDILGAPAVEGTPPVTPVEGTPPAVEAPWGAEDTWKLGEGESATDWYNAIPEEAVREAMKSKGYKNPAELAMGYHSLMKMQRNSDDAIIVPGENAKPEDIAAFNKKMGVPENAEGYEFKPAEGVEHDKDLMDFFRGAAFKGSMSKSKAAEFITSWDEFVSVKSEAMAAEEVTKVDALKTHYGEAMPEAKEAGRRAIDALGLSPEHVEALDGQLGTAAVTELMIKIGMKGKEGEFTGTVSQQGKPSPGTMSKAQAAAEIAKLQADEVFQKAYNNSDLVVRGPALKRMEALFAAS